MVLLARLLVAVVSCGLVVSCKKDEAAKLPYSSTATLLCAESWYSGNPAGVYDADEGDPRYRGDREIFESGEIRRRTLDRMAELHPEVDFKDTDADIAARVEEGTCFLHVTARSDHPRPDLYLNVLLGVYIDFVREMFEKGGPAAPVFKGMNEVVKAEKAFLYARQALRLSQAENEASLRAEMEMARAAYRSAKEALAACDLSVLKERRNIAVYKPAQPPVRAQD